MSVVHHLSMSSQTSPIWALFTASLRSGDVVILLDEALRDATAIATALSALPVRIRCFIPQLEMAISGQSSLPAGIADLDDESWLTLIAQQDVLEWN